MIMIRGLNILGKISRQMHEGLVRPQIYQFPRIDPGCHARFSLKKISQNKLGQALRLLSSRQAPRFLSGQAAVEMAILGSLILLIFSTLLAYGQRMDSQVDMKMEAFRKALNRAYARNAAVSYTLKKDKRFYNLMAGYGESQPSTLSASSTVMWQKGIAGCQDGGGCKNKRDDGTAQSSFAYYEINNQLIGQTDGDVEGDDIMIPRYKKFTKSYTDEDQDEGTTMKVPASVWFDVTKRKSTYTTQAKKKENATAINNRQEIKLNDNVYTKAFFRFDKATTDAREDTHIPEYVYEGQSYVYDKNTYTIADPKLLYGPSGFVRQGAFYNEENNRIEYDPTVAEDSELIKWRNWQTNN